MLARLYKEIDDKDIKLVYCDIPHDLSGLYANNIIYLSDKLTKSEELCVLAEEIGHYETSSGNILDYSNLDSWKQEIKARNWAVNELVTLDKLIDAYNQGVRNKYELAEYLGITIDFLDYSIARLKQQYGITAVIGDYVIYFEPNLMIFKGEIRK